jgi:hypothetical protein
LSGALALVFSYTIPFIVLVVGFFTSLDSGGAAGAKIKGLANQAWGATGGAAIGAASGYAVGRGQALGAWTRGGAVGTLGTIYGANGGSPLNYDDREAARENWKKWKQGAGDTVRGTPVIGALAPKSKEYMATRSYSNPTALDKAKSDEIKKNLSNASDVQKAQLKKRYDANRQKMLTKQNYLESKLSDAEKTGIKENISLAQKNLTNFAKKQALLEYHIGTWPRDNEEGEMWNRPNF